MLLVHISVSKWRGQLFPICTWPQSFCPDSLVLVSFKQPLPWQHQSRRPLISAHSRLTVECLHTPTQAEGCFNKMSPAVACLHAPHRLASGALAHATQLRQTTAAVSSRLCISLNQNRQNNTCYDVTRYLQDALMQPCTLQQCCSTPVIDESVHAGMLLVESPCSCSRDVGNWSLPCCTCTATGRIM